MPIENLDSTAAIVSMTDQHLISWEKVVSGSPRSLVIKGVPLKSRNTYAPLP